MIYYPWGNLLYWTINIFALIEIVCCFWAHFATQPGFPNKLCPLVDDHNHCFCLTIHLQSIHWKRLLIRLNLCWLRPIPITFPLASQLWTIYVNGDRRLVLLMMVHHRRNVASAQLPRQVTGTWGKHPDSGSRPQPHRASLSPRSLHCYHETLEVTSGASQKLKFMNTLSNCRNNPIFNHFKTRGIESKVERCFCRQYWQS